MPHALPSFQTANGALSGAWGGLGVVVACVMRSSPVLARNPLQPQCREWRRCSARPTPDPSGYQARGEITALTAPHGGDRRSLRFSSREDRTPRSPSFRRSIS
jgi:hypothetical protein